jgi:hypothetical protein
LSQQQSDLQAVLLVPARGIGLALFHYGLRQTGCRVGRLPDPGLDKENTMKRLFVLLALTAFLAPMLAGCEAEGRVDDDGVRMEIDD